MTVERMKDWRPGKGVKAAGLRILAVLIVLIILGGACLFTLAEDEYGVVTKFGKIVSVQDNAGLHFKMPFIEQVTIVPKAIQLYDIAP